MFRTFSHRPVFPIAPPQKKSNRGDIYPVALKYDTALGQYARNNWNIVNGRFLDSSTKRNGFFPAKMKS